MIVAEVHVAVVRQNCQGCRALWLETTLMPILPASAIGQRAQNEQA
jgi:hypothetical protein